MTGKPASNNKKASKKTSAARSRNTAQKLVLQEQVRISQSKELKKQLEKLLTAKKKIQIDASNVQKIDTSGIQLLTAFAIKAHKETIEIDWQSPSEPFVAAARLLNLNEYLGLDKKKTLNQLHYAMG